LIFFNVNLVSQLNVNQVQELQMGESATTAVDAPFAGA